MRGVNCEQIPARSNGAAPNPFRRWRALLFEGERPAASAAARNVAAGDRSEHFAGPEPGAGSRRSGDSGPVPDGRGARQARRPARDGEAFSQTRQLLGDGSDGQP